MDVRWDQALDSLEMDRQAIIDCTERLRASLASLKSDSRKIKDLATGEAYAGLFRHYDPIQGHGNDRSPRS